MHENGQTGCIYKNCPDWVEGHCKETAVLKCYPDVAFTPPNPYRLDTRSINSVSRMSSNILEIWDMLKVAHTIKERSLNKELEFNGFFGVELYLVHKKIRSGGRDVYITEIHPTKELRNMITEPISKGLSLFQGSNPLSLNNAGKSLLENKQSDVKAIDMSDIDDDVKDGVNIANEFAARS